MILRSHRRNLMVSSITSMRLFDIFQNLYIMVILKDIIGFCRKIE